MSIAPFSPLWSCLVAILGKSTIATTASYIQNPLVPAWMY